ncbi:MAG: FAD-binding oxidoreductase [Bryobacteraceae bacterium]
MNDSKYMIGRITERREVTNDLWIVRLRPAEPIAFRPGQYVTVGLPGIPRMVERAYSVASSPDEPELEFFLELVPGGELTPQLYHVPVGGEVFLRRSAKGRFNYDDKSGHPNHLMVATVTGVAPFVSIVRSIAARVARGEPMTDRVVLLQAASLRQELGYFEELTAMAERHAWLRYVPSLSRIWLSSEWTGERGRAEDIVRKYLDQSGFAAGDTTAYVCGNPDMVENVKGVLRRAGFPKESIKEEAYWVGQKS